MKQRKLAVLAGSAVLLLALTGCSNSGKTMSQAESKMKEDVSGAMSRAESFLEGDDHSGVISDGHAESGFVDDKPHDGSSVASDHSEASRVHEDDENSHTESKHAESSSHPAE